MALEKIGVEAVVEGLSSFRRGLKQIDNSVTGVGKSAKKTTPSIQNMFKSFLTTGAAVAAIGAVGKAIVDFSKESVAEFQTFEKQASEVFTLMPGLTTEAMDSMKGDILSFSAAVGRQTDETVPALYQAISAGVPQENVFDFMKIASDAALGGVTDLETAVDGITSVVNAYGADVIDAAAASDVMFTAVRLGKTDFEQLSKSLFNVIPTAASLGVSFEDVAANLAALTAQGTPTSVATTQLRAAFVEAAKSGSKLDNALKELTGKSFPELVATGQSSSEIFTTLRDSMPEQDFRDLFSSVEASNAVLGITNDTAAGVIDSFGELEDTIGATAAAAETMAGTMEHLEQKAAAATEAFKIQAGESLSPLKKRYLETKIAIINYSSAQQALKAAVDNGNISFAEAIKLNAQMKFTSATAADTMLALEQATIATSFAGSSLANSSLMVVDAIEAETLAIIRSTEEIQADALARSEAAGVNEVLADKIMQTSNQLTENEIAIRAGNAATLEGIEANTELAISEEMAAAAAQEMAAVQEELTAKMGGYFASALTATGETKSLEMQLLDSAIAAGASATEIAILAANTGEFSQEQIQAAFEAANMKASIDNLVQSMQSGAITADEATAALDLLQSAEATTAQEAINMATGISNANAELDNVSGAAVDAANALSEIPTDINVRIKISTEGEIPSLPTQGQPVGKGQAFQKGGFTGQGASNALAGMVHFNEMVIPEDVLRRGVQSILGFVEANVPGGIRDFSPSIGRSTPAQPSFMPNNTMSSTINNDVQMDFGGQTINNDVDMQFFRDFILRTVRDNI